MASDHLTRDIDNRCGPHRGPEGPNEDLAMCPTCGRPSHAMRPEGETYGHHLPDCSLPLRHPSHCQPGGAGHPAAAKIRGFWPAGAITAAETYTTIVARDEDTWTAEVVGLQGARTYAPNLIELDSHVREVIALTRDMPDGAEARLKVEYVFAPGTAWTDFTPAEAAEMGLDLGKRSDITAPLNELGERCPWPWDPEQLGGQPIGQYHCPYCGGMQLAGHRHLDTTGQPDGPEPDDLDRYIAEQRATDPAFKAAYDREQPDGPADDG